MKNNYLTWVPFAFVGLWSTGFIGAKYAMPYAEPFTFLALRSFITIIVLFLILVLLSIRKNGGGEFQQMIVGALVHGGYLGGVFYAIYHGFPAGMSALIVSLQPLLTALISSLMGLKPMSYREWSGLWLGLMGAALVVYGRYGFHSAELHLLPLIAVFVSLFSISIGTVLQKIWGGKTSIVYGNIWQYLGALIVFGVLSSLGETHIIDWQPPLILALIWLVFGLSIGATLLLMLMIREGEVAKVASYFYLVPPLVLIEAWILFDEKLSFISILGAILVVIGVYLAARKSNSVSVKA